jgi:hypothetical protein
MSGSQHAGPVGGWFGKEWHPTQLVKSGHAGSKRLERYAGVGITLGAFVRAGIFAAAESTRRTNYRTDTMNIKETFSGWPMKPVGEELRLRTQRRLDVAGQTRRIRRKVRKVVANRG